MSYGQIPTSHEHY